MLNFTSLQGLLVFQAKPGLNVFSRNNGNKLTGYKKLSTVTNFNKFIKFNIYKV